MADHTKDFVLPCGCFFAHKLNEMGAYNLAISPCSMTCPNLRIALDRATEKRKPIVLKVSG